ncbi:cytochrome c oxidase subunit 7C, mitochondrial-like [Pteronotus mesoamericanus]|uniref:cytochrome c oxidase subunit 7C, mitochondrial-like n=1 Tax=Pteronotus mesoamericanus TaxID=1884717 RepID=UPI0023EB7DB4|nr:cytochrome c oxidase subunit 7C, mitochondrial-like [Pteronotus parnellii mesoamericanus]
MLGQSIWRVAVSVVHRSHYQEGPGNNLPFQWKTSRVMMTMYFGSGFAIAMFLVRHQLLKK